MNEFVLADRDGNLLRFGEELPSRSGFLNAVDLCAASYNPGLLGFWALRFRFKLWSWMMSLLQ
jgi:hypothetical protein